MKAVTKIFAGAAAAAVAAGAFSAPAAAQYYPGTQPGYGSGGGIIGAMIDQILRGQGYGHNNQRYSQDRQLVERCIAAVTNRLERQTARYGAPYGAPYGSPYGSPYGYGGYGNYGQASNAQVLGITRVDRRSSGLRVRGEATANAQAAAYGAPYGNAYGSPYGAPYGNAYGYGQQARPVGELSFRCDVDYRGRIRDIDIDRNHNVGYYDPYRR